MIMVIIVIYSVIITETLYHQNIVRTKHGLMVLDKCHSIVLLRVTELEGAEHL